MPRLVMTGWNKGMKKVSLSMLLKEDAHLGLREAKRCVDRLLEGETVVIELPPTCEPRAMATKVRKLGIECEVQPHAAPTPPSASPAP